MPLTAKHTHTPHTHTFLGTWGVISLVRRHVPEVQISSARRRHHAVWGGRGGMCVWGGVLFISCADPCLGTLYAAVKSSRLYIKKYTHTHTHTHTHKYMHMHVNVCIYTRIHACMHACIHTYVYTYMHIMHIHTHSTCACVGWDTGTQCTRPQDLLAA
jgi:hypothetical protein